MANGLGGGIASAGQSLGKGIQDFGRNMYLLKEQERQRKELAKRLKEEEERKAAAFEGFKMMVKNNPYLQQNFSLMGKSIDDISPNQAMGFMESITSMNKMRAQRLADQKLMLDIDKHRLVLQEISERKQKEADLLKIVGEASRLADDKIPPGLRRSVMRYRAGLGVDPELTSKEVSQREPKLREFGGARFVESGQGTLHKLEGEKKMTRDERIKAHWSRISRQLGSLRGKSETFGKYVAKAYKKDPNSDVFYLRPKAPIVVKGKEMPQDPTAGLDPFIEEEIDDINREHAALFGRRLFVRDNPFTSKVESKPMKYQKKGEYFEPLED